MTCAELLIAGGAGLEIIGVLTVVYEIGGSLRRAREIEPKGVTIHAPPARTYEQARPGKVVQPPPPLEQRVTAIEDDLFALRGQLDDRLLEQRKALDAEVDRKTVDLRQGLQDLTDSFKRLLSDVLRSGASARIAGVVLIVLGIITSSVGSLIAT